jgi:hypothetical protein
MLITLQSNSDSDASDFTNFFKETVQIPEHAEIALLGCSYKFTKSFTVTALNNTFTVRWGTSGNLQATIAEGEYTPDQFLSALNVALQDLIADPTLPYRIQLAFPANAQSWAFTDSNKARIKLTLTYTPDDWDGAFVDKDSLVERQQITLTADAMMANITPDGIVNKTSYSNNFIAQKFTSGNPDGTILWGHAEGNEAGETPHGVIRFQVPEVQRSIVVAKVGAVPADFVPATGDFDVAVNTLSASNFEIIENSGGILSTIHTAGYTAGDRFEIRFDQTDSTTGKSPRYFKNTLTNSDFVEIVIDPAQPRLVYTGLSKIYCGGCIGSPMIIGGIIPNPASIGGNTPYQLASVLTESLVFEDAGTNYVDQEICDCLGLDSGKKAVIRVRTDALGVIQSYSCQSSEGGFTSPLGVGESISVTGRTSTQAGAVLSYTAGATGAHSNFTNLVAGSGYTAGDVDIIVGGITITGAITIQVDASGGVTDFGWVSEAKINEVGSSLALGVSPLDIIQISDGVGTNAQFTVRNTRDVIPQFANVGWTTTDKDVDEPLEAHDDVRFQCPQEFRDVSGMPLDSGVKNADGGTVITGNRSIGTDRETQQMLINVEEFNIKSICKTGGVQKAVAMLPFGAIQPAIAGGGGQAEKIDGEYYYEPYNMVYHRFENPHLVNHNQLRVRFTDAVGLPLNQLQHPVTVTLDLRPRAN